MQADDTESRVLALMRDITTMTLATSSKDVPWATDVYYANIGYDLLFFFLDELKALRKPQQERILRCDNSPSCR
jgi:hypothetical protein